MSFWTKKSSHLIWLQMLLTPPRKRGSQDFCFRHLDNNKNVMLSLFLPILRRSVLNNLRIHAYIIADAAICISMLLVLVFLRYMIPALLVLQLLFAAAFSAAIPILQDKPSAAPVEDAVHEETLLADENGAVQPVSFDVQVDRLAQLVSTHWQFDHLESIVSEGYTQIANQMKDHIAITVHSSSSQQQIFSATQLTLDTMDFDLLKSQIAGAVQARTEGDLPALWDNVADKLSRFGLEAYVKHLVLQSCGDTGTAEDTVSFDCLKDRSAQLLSQIDRHVSRHLAHAFDVINSEFLPNLLQHITEDLHQVLAYFNQEFLSKDDLSLSLQVIPWQRDERELRTRLLRLATASTEETEDHGPQIVANYAQLARV